MTHEQYYDLNAGDRVRIRYEARGGHYDNGGQLSNGRTYIILGWDADDDAYIEDNRGNLYYLCCFDDWLLVQQSAIESFKEYLKCLD